MVATSLAEVEFLVEGYCSWCRLLNMKLNAAKTQIWGNKGPVGRSVKLKFGDKCVTLATRETFRIVGIELGASERLATRRSLYPAH